MKTFKEFKTKQGLYDFVKTIRNDDYFTEIWNWYSLNYLAYRNNSFQLIKWKDWEIINLRNTADLYTYLKKI